MTATPDQTTSLNPLPGVVIDAGVPHARAMRALLDQLSPEERTALAEAFEANPDAFNPFALPARKPKQKGDAFRGLTSPAQASSCTSRNES